MKRSLPRIGAALLAVCFLPAPSHVRAERTAWNQELVAIIAADLALAVEKVKTSVESDPEQGTVLQERKRQAALVDLRRLSELSADLAAKLKAGQGREETAPIYEQMQTVRQEAREAGREILNPASTVEDIVAARRLIEKLTPYYESR